MHKRPHRRPRIPATCTPTARNSGTARSGRRVAAEISSAGLRARLTARRLYNASIIVARVRDITDAVERLAPPSLAEDWDNCGLQVEIGRASCRERGVDLGGRRIIKKK